MYKVLTDLPLEVQEFYSEIITMEATGETVAVPYEYVDDTGLLVTKSREEMVFGEVITLVKKVRPPTKSKEDLERVIAKGKRQSILDTFSILVSIGDSWDWFESYLEYEHQLAIVLDHNNSLVADEFGVIPDSLGLPYLKPKDVRTSTKVLAPFVREVSKKGRTEALSLIKVEVDGMSFDADEKSLLRITIRMASMPLATTTVQWVLSDNTVASVKRSQLKSVLTKAAIESDLIWLA